MQSWLTIMLGPLLGDELQKLHVGRLLQFPALPNDRTKTQKQPQVTRASLEHGSVDG